MFLSVYVQPCVQAHLSRPLDVHLQRLLCGIGECVHGLTLCWLPLLPVVCPLLLLAALKLRYRLPAPATMQKLRSSAEKRVEAAHEQLQHLTTQLEAAQVDVSLARSLAARLDEAREAGSTQAEAAAAAAQQRQQAEAAREARNDAQAAQLEAQLGVVAGDHEVLQQRFAQLEAELESVRRSSAQEKAHLQGAQHALATELEEERRASAQSLAYQLETVQKDVDAARTAADQLQEAHRDAAAARALAAELKEARRQASAAQGMAAELEAARLEAASARALAAQLQMAQQELQHAQSHAVELEAAQREAAAAQAQATTAKGRNVLLEKAWTAALEVSRGCSDHNLLGNHCFG